MTDTTKIDNTPKEPDGPGVPHLGPAQEPLVPFYRVASQAEQLQRARRAEAWWMRLWRWLWRWR